MKGLKKYPTKKILHDLFIYKNNELYWKIKRCKVRKDKPAGYIHSSKYRFIRINNSLYKAHRLIYIFHYGDVPKKMEIDHVDKNPLNNSIDNLRLVTHQQNCLNTKSKGHYYNKKRGKWFAAITINGVYIFLGYFVEKDNAEKKYISERDKYFKLLG